LNFLDRLCFDRYKIDNIVHAAKRIPIRAPHLRRNFSSRHFAHSSALCCFVLPCAVSSHKIDAWHRSKQDGLYITLTDYVGCCGRAKEILSEVVQSVETWRTTGQSIAMSNEELERLL